MTEQRNARVIKKYPNRRLYDTEESRYITLEDILRLVRDSIDFTVIDKKSQTDITRNILLQVISEQESKGRPILTRDFLSRVIRSYGEPDRADVSCYLEQCLRLFLEQRPSSGGEYGGAGPSEEVARLSYHRWRSLQDEIYTVLRRGLEEDGQASRAPEG